MTYCVIAEHWWSSYCVQIYLRSIVCYPWIGFELLQSKYNMKSDLAAIIREQMPHAAASGFILDHGIVHLNRSQPPSRLSIDRILAPQMLRNVQYLNHQKYVPVAPLAQHITTVFTKSDIHKLFIERSCTALIYMRHKAISHSTKSAKNHPLWSELYLEIRFEVPSYLYYQLQWTRPWNNFPPTQKRVEEHFVWLCSKAPVSCLLPSQTGPKKSAKM
jgi:hypothetical protein